MKKIGTTPIKNPVRLKDILRRPEVEFSKLFIFNEEFKNLSQAVIEEVSFQVKYEGYIKRQAEQVAKFKKWENMKLPPETDYYSIPWSIQRNKRKVIQIAACFFRTGCPGPRGNSSSHYPLTSISS
ncbi:MAG: tRNA uridine 5-carboxymethylaminomethyl modification enzyme MnmG [Candidatus Methanoperedenaceae archaeon GB37]|nr:MAG: tRNA uridine 5-carboxymethylaminomethyl modification enzyme MnmG [Candidatus Methanoperedenaceae archaeon GB37]